MSLPLEKGQRINIEKESGGGSKFVIGCGWDASTDVDISAFLCKADPNGGNAIPVGPPGAVYWGQKTAPGVDHLGDALSGEGNAPGVPDEYICIDTSKLQPEVDVIDVWANIYSVGPTFGQVKDAFIKIYTGVGDGTAMKPDTEMLKYDLTEDYSTATAVQFGTLYKKDGQWRFQAMDHGDKLTIRDLLASYNAIS